MATLKQIKGSAIQFLAEDPVEYAGTWSSGGSLNTARDVTGLSNVGTQTATLASGGDTVGNGTGVTAITESYNGSAWTELNDLNSARSNAYGSGSTTAAFHGGGYTGTAKDRKSVV